MFYLVKCMLESPRSSKPFCLCRLLLKISKPSTITGSEQQRTHLVGMFRRVSKIIKGSDNCGLLIWDNCRKSGIVHVEGIHVELVWEIAHTVFLECWEADLWKRETYWPEGGNPGATVCCPGTIGQSLKDSRPHSNQHWTWVLPIPFSKKFPQQ